MAIGAIKALPKDRKFYAKNSGHWKCATCQMTNAEIAQNHMLTFDTEQARQELNQDNVIMNKMETQVFNKKQQKPATSTSESEPVASK
jgi:hypothetical protein